MTIDAIQYDEVAFNSEEDFEQCRSSYSTFFHIESEQLVASITHHDKKISIWKFNENTIHPMDRKSDTMKNIKNIKLDYSVVEAMHNYLDSVNNVNKSMNKLNSLFINSGFILKGDEKQEEQEKQTVSEDIKD